MKTILALLVFLFASATYAQTASTQAAAPGCGTDNAKFDVTSDKHNHPFVKPEPGKAVVYFLQDDSHFESRPRPTTRFGLNGSWIGATTSNSYFFMSVEPGEHHLCAGWQNFVGFTEGHKSGAAHFTAEPGGLYFFIVRNRYLREGKEIAGMSLDPVDADQAQLLMSKFAFTTSRARK
jgi:hypothetical protein